MKRVSRIIVMALLIAAMSVSVVAAGGNGNGSNNPDSIPTWSG